jgi:hypothetical protein
MYNNYLSTIPQYADKLRTKGIQTPEPIKIYYEPIESSNPAQKDYRNRWRDESRQNVLNRLESIDRSKKFMITEQQFLPRGRNTAQMPFQTSQNMPSFSESRRGGNVTSSSALTSNQYEDFRQKLLKNRLDDYEKQKTTTLQPLTTAPSTLSPLPRQPASNVLLTASERSGLDIILQSIEQKIGKGITDDTTYTDLLRVVQYFTLNIWKYEEPTELIAIIRRLESIATNVSADIKNKESDQLSDRNNNNTKYGKLIEVTIDNLINYIEKNASFIGRSQTERKVLASSTVPLNKPSQIIPEQTIKTAQELTAPEPEEGAEGDERPPPAPVEGEEGEALLPLPPLIGRVPLPTSPNFQPSQYDKETLQRIAFELGIRPIYEVDSKEVLKTLIYNQLNPASAQSLQPIFLRRRQKNPALYAPLAGQGRRRNKKGGNWFTDQFKPDSTLRNSIIPSLASAGTLAGMMLAPEVVLPYQGLLLGLEALATGNSALASLGLGKPRRKGGKGGISSGMASGISKGLWSLAKMSAKQGLNDVKNIGQNLFNDSKPILGQLGNMFIRGYGKKGMKGRKGGADTSWYSYAPIDRTGQYYNQANGLWYPHIMSVQNPAHWMYFKHINTQEGIDKFVAEGKRRGDICEKACKGERQNSQCRDYVPECN